MNSTKRTPKERASDFVGALRRISNDRGKLAALRRGLTSNPRLQVDAWPVVANLGGDISQPVYVAVAALFAEHQDQSQARNFGETCRSIALANSTDGKPSDSVERRFRRLLACVDAADVISQLRSWIRLAGSSGKGVNYESLFADLWNWQWYQDEIRVKWARSFWQTGKSTPQENSTQITAS
ncbi:type I-E CRISPR-associated protein Cse2/CasB [bacterium]|jgi:CRISPR type I-E-associated protein CasB/Cse2|nr:type I-E CRISPR-associated protein Cse2/CasB [bacterium]